LTFLLEVKIPLEVHHINGVNTDHRLENLQLLCPNCHSLTNNFRGTKKKVSALAEKRDAEYRKFKETLTDGADGNLEPNLTISKEGAETRHGIPESTNPCPICGKIIKDSRNKHCSRECYLESNRKNIPKVPELLKVFKGLRTYVAVAEKYNVSDVAVKKWCVGYGIVDMVKE
jgi:hypothetical protein